MDGAVTATDGDVGGGSGWQQSVTCSGTNHHYRGGLAAFCFVANVIGLNIGGLDILLRWQLIESCYAPSTSSGPAILK